MFLLGHVGITITAVKAMTKAPVDYRMVALFSILPDLIDKPIGLALSHQLGNNTRLVGHTLIIALFILGFGFFNRNKNGLIYSFAYLMHFFLDRIWQPHDLPIFLFPFLGMPTPMADSAFVRWRAALFTGYNMWGEIIGLSLIIWIIIAHGLYRKEAALRFYRVGEII